MIVDNKEFWRTVKLSLSKSIEEITIENDKITTIDTTNLLITKFDDINLLPLGTFNSDLKATSKYNDHCSNKAIKGHFS